MWLELFKWEMFYSDSDLFGPIVGWKPEIRKSENDIQIFIKDKYFIISKSKKWLRGFRLEIGNFDFAFVWHKWEKKPDTELIERAIEGEEIGTLNDYSEEDSSDEHNKSDSSRGFLITDETTLEEIEAYLKDFKARRESLNE